MKQKTVLFLSIGLTAFVLVVLSAVTMRAPALLDKISGQSSDSAVEQIIADREQEYIDALNLANQQIAEMQEQLNTPDPTETPVSDRATITADQAALIGQEAAMDGYSLIGAAELVDYEGELAYEVPFNDGQIYVNAVTGEVLFNGTIVYGPTTISANDAAQIASDYMNRQDARNVRLAVLNGQEVYRVSFPGNNIVFVSKYGSLLQVRLADDSRSGEDHDDDHEEHEEHGDNDD